MRRAPRWRAIPLAAAATGLGIACGSASPTSGFGEPPGNDDAGGAEDAPSFKTDGGSDASACEAPDMLIVLDRTLSMGRAPNGSTPANTDAGHGHTKWLLATDVVTHVTSAPRDQTVRFGLELFPLDPQTVTDAGATGACVTLTQELAGATATNTPCTPGEVDVMPALGTGAQIATVLDPEKRRLCISTPIASALDTATAQLASIAAPTRKQFVLLVTDGGETCRGTGAVGVVQALAAAGVGTYVVGFGAKDAGSGGVNRVLLNDLACAGRTAPNFPSGCTLDDGGGGYVASAPKGADLFFTAEDGASLEAALGTIEGQICCGCAR